MGNAHQYMEEECRQRKFDTYMRADFYNILKRESEITGTPMSALLKNAFAINNYKKYPVLKKYFTGD